jgi:DNA-directed RNA polymerase specialized sigma24 family protein
LDESLCREYLRATSVGDERARSAVMRELGPQVRDFLLRILRGNHSNRRLLASAREDAEDVASMVILKLLDPKVRHPRGVEGASAAASIMGWSRRVVFNHLVRRKQHRDRELLEVGDSSESPMAGPDPGPTRPAPTPPHDLSHDDEARANRELLAACYPRALPLFQFTLRQSGANDVAAAEVLGLSVPYVQKMRQRLKLYTGARARLVEDPSLTTEAVLSELGYRVNEDNSRIVSGVRNYLCSRPRGSA